MTPAFSSRLSAVWMTPSHGSSIGVAYAPKTLSLSLFPPPPDDSLSPPPQPAASASAARSGSQNRCEMKARDGMGDLRRGTGARRLYNLRETSSRRARTGLHGPALDTTHGRFSAPHQRSPPAPSVSRGLDRGRRGRGLT